MVAATAINPNLSVVLSPSPDADIARAIELWEQANELLVDAGRIFADIKEETKRKFNKLVEAACLEKTQVSKLIKVAECASEIPSVVAARLGLPMLLQLSQPRSQTAREAIAASDTQTLVAQKIKELRKPAVPKEEKPVRFVGNQKGGVGKLRIEVPGCPEAVELERDWEASGLPPLQWLERRVREQGAGGKGILAWGEEEEEIVQQDCHLDSSTVSPASTIVENVVIPDDEQTVAQAELERYISEQALECDLVEAIATQEGDAASTGVEVISEQTTTDQCYAPVTATERYKLGWKVGDSAVANSVGGEYFVRWCDCQSVRIESVSGKVGEIQTLRVARYDELTDMSFGNWIESVPELLQTKVLEFARETPVVQVVSDTPSDSDCEKLSKMLLKTKKWEKVSFLVERNGEILSEAIANLSLEQKSELIVRAIAYIEANKRAILCHEMDWMPIESLKQVFSRLSFKVHDIAEGLAAPWYDKCTFIDVTNLGSDDDEIWTFASGGKEIKAYSREDFEVSVF